MTKVLGLDLRTNSIGWAVTDTDSNKVINRGVTIFPGPVFLHAHERRRLFKSKQKKKLSLGSYVVALLAG